MTIDVVATDKDYSTYASVKSKFDFTLVLNDPCASTTITTPVFTRQDYTPEKNGFTKDFDSDFSNDFSQDSTPNCPNILTMFAG